MEDLSNEVVKKNKPDGCLRGLLIGGAIYVALVALGIAAAAYLLVAHPYFGPKAQAILKPDPLRVSTVEHADLVSDAEVLTARARALGTRVTFRADEKNQIIAEGPAQELTREFLDKVSPVGLLELVDFGMVPVEKGAKIATDFKYPYLPVPPGTKRHTLMTNADFAYAQAQAGQLEGQFQIAFTLTESGKKTLADFSASHILHYLAIVMDKTVLSCPVIKNAITDGQGIIEGGFTKDSAGSLAAYLRVRGPLPIPVVVVSIGEVGK